MKTLSLVLLLAAGTAFVLMGCSDNGTPLVSPNGEVASSVTSQASLAKGAVLHSVTGSGNIWLGGKMGVLTITGHLYADQSVSGVLDLVSTAWMPGAKMHGKVVALTFYENYSFSNGVAGPTALFWWVESTLEGYEGKYFASFVVDNGQGKNDWVGGNVGPYDAVTSLTPQDIADAWPEYFVPLDVGNVTIH